MFEQVYRHTRKIIAAIYAVMAALLIWAGTLPDGYMIHVRRIIEVQPYPVWPVLLELLILAALYMMFAWALSSNLWERLWKLLVCLTIDIIVSLLIAITMMHAPTYHAFFLFSVFLLTLFVLLALLLLSVLGLNKKLASKR